jgi:hypothetical protein
LTQSKPVTLAEIQQQVLDDTLLLQYSLGEERSYLQAVTKTSITSYELLRHESWCVCGASMMKGHPS